MLAYVGICEGVWHVVNVDIDSQWLTECCLFQQLEHKQREFFVKWHDLSYWHCEWVSELQVQWFTILCSFPVFSHSLHLLSCPLLLPLCCYCMMHMQCVCVCVCVCATALCSDVCLSFRHVPVLYWNDWMDWVGFRHRSYPRLILHCVVRESWYLQK